MYLFDNLSDVAVIDCETTGLNPQNDRIVAYAIILMDLKKDSQDTTHMVGTLDPGVPIPAGAYEVHGISNADVRGHDKFGEVAESITDFIADRPLLGFNVSFDKAFFNAELKRNGFKTFHRKSSYCVMEALEEAWGYRPRLEDAVEQLSVANQSIRRFLDQMHDPLNDATATAHLAAMIQRIPLDDLKNMTGDTWEDQPPTQRQLDYIYDLGGDISRITSKRQASDEIDRLLGN